VVNKVYAFQFFYYIASPAETVLMCWEIMKAYIEKTF